MTTPEALRATASRRLDAYEKSLVSVLTGGEGLEFPVRLAGRQTGGTYAEARALVEASDQNRTHGWSIRWETRRDRYGNESHDMKAIEADTPEALAAIAGRTSGLVRFRKALGILLKAFPDKVDELASWTQALDVRKALEQERPDGYWSDIAMVTKWATERKQRDDIYMREIPLPVDTKFIERESGILAGLYVALSHEEMPEGSHRMEKLYGLKIPPRFVRFRTYDGADTSVTAETFRMLDKERDLDGISRVFVVENQAVYLSFPLSDGDMCVFGSGFASLLAKGAEWLNGRRILYYGDLDEYGLEILSRFRELFPKTESFLMDAETYENWKRFAVPGTSPKSTDAYANLTESERKLLMMLQKDPMHSRLEQEKIPTAYVGDAMSGLDISNIKNRTFT